MIEPLIRKAATSDAQSIFDLRIAAINSQCTSHYAAPDLEMWTAGPMSPSFVNMVEDKAYVAMLGDKVVASGMIDLESGKIDAVFVLPSLMRQGIGGRMMAHLEQLARDAGLHQVRLDATLNAAPFYRAEGFTGDVIAKYCTSAGLPLDCIPMTKELSASA